MLLAEAHSTPGRVVEMSGYVWKQFGILAKVSADGQMVTITNEAGSTRQMSMLAYKESAEAVYHKCFPLIGQAVNIQTSQNTAKWNPLIWFSDVSVTTNFKITVNNDN
ncbi:TPA: hypothetical protein ACGD2I_000492 [Aeromonas hydrophila]|nr:hypothetical protein [Aeromonas hydrophila]QBX71777.1 hypothetical protein E4625_13650 [Aeromonas hydrophila]QBX76477.1 hypothetical protein E4630_13430 [Aeromonas hydrophila]